MALDASLVGRTAEPVSTKIEADRVHAYVKAVGDTNPAYPQGPGDAQDKLAPPSFAAVYALFAGSLSLASAGIAPSRLIHGGQEFSWTRALRVGETVTAQGRIADIYHKRNLQFVESEAVVTDEAGEEICRSRSTILVLPDPAAAGNGA